MKPASRRARLGGLLVASFGFLPGCGGGAAAPEAPGFAARFVADRGFRRESLERAVVTPGNTYSALRLARYATEASGVPTGWDALDARIPVVRPLTTAAKDGEGGARGRESAPVWDGVPPASDAGWLALGRRAFELWPVEIDDLVGELAADPAARTAFGLFVDDRGGVGGLVWVAGADGLEHAAWTCSGCHSRPDDEGHLVAGRPAVELDRGAMSPRAADGSAPGAWEWGKGRLDVTADGVSNPVTIPDLRATSHQSHLHWEATLVNSLPALAVRVDTLIIESASERLRPPREISVALALYIESLGGHPGLGDETTKAARTAGAAVFDSHCARCHHADGSTAPPLLAEVVGTDRRVADGTSRGTGHYRIPSLWSVGDRGQLLHDGSIPDLATLLDPSRRSGPSGEPGAATPHPFGLELNAPDRDALIAFVETIGR